MSNENNTDSLIAVLAQNKALADGALAFNIEQAIYGDSLVPMTAQVDATNFVMNILNNHRSSPITGVTPRIIAAIELAKLSALMLRANDIQHPMAQAVKVIGSLSDYYNRTSKFDSIAPVSSQGQAPMPVASNGKLDHQENNPEENKTEENKETVKETYKLPDTKEFSLLTSSEEELEKGIGEMARKFAPEKNEGSSFTKNKLERLEEKSVA